MKSITSFKGTFLSNFWPAQVFYRGVVWPTVEHAYQASKCALDVDFERFKGLNAGQAKRLGNGERAAKSIRQNDEGGSPRLVVFLE